MGDGQTIRFKSVAGDSKTARHLPDSASDQTKHQKTQWTEITSLFTNACTAKYKPLLNFLLGKAGGLIAIVMQVHTFLSEHTHTDWSTTTM